MAVTNAVQPAVRSALATSVAGSGGGEVHQLVTLGKTTPGDQPLTTAAAGFAWACGPYLAASSGTIQSISFYARQASRQITMGVWDDNAGVVGSLVASTAEGTTLLDDWLTLAATGSIVSGRSYWIGWNVSFTTSVDYDNAAAGTTKYKLVRIRQALCLIRTQHHQQHLVDDTRFI
jgi:hypothetical protein